MSITKSYVEKFMDVRDDYVRNRGTDEIDPTDSVKIIDKLNKMVKDELVKLQIHAMGHGNVETVSWCKQQLEREKKRPELRIAERLVPSGILDAVDDPSPSHMRRPSANPALALSALDVYDWKPSPHIGLHPDLYHFPEAPARAFVNPFSNRPSALQEFVPSNPLSAVASAFNPDANVRCNRCNQLGHRRAACPNPPVPGHRGGKTRTNKHKKGKKSKKSNKSNKSNKSKKH